jgi:hypothetical protein
VPDHHLPLRPADLVRKLADEPALTIFEREQFRALCQFVAATIHHDYHARHLALQAAYAPFDPDDDSAALFPVSDEQRHVARRALLKQFDELLARANYRRLPAAEIEEALRSPGPTGLQLKLDLDQFEELAVFVRGDCQLPQASRSRTARGAQPVPAYRRLAVIFRLKEAAAAEDGPQSRPIMLKLFKDVPRADVESLLPGAKVRMSLVEQARIVLPTLSGLGLTLFKLLKGASSAAMAGMYGLIAVLGLAGGAVGYGVRSFYGYVQARERHQLSLTRHLYFQNLDNNAGVIHHLLAEAEEQEFRELILAWWHLWHGSMAGATAHEIDETVERWLRVRCGIEADFEVADALDKLQGLELAYVSRTGRWRAVGIEEALETLDRRWDEEFDFGGRDFQQHRLRRAA